MVTCQWRRHVVASGFTSCCSTTPNSCILHPGSPCPCPHPPHSKLPTPISKTRSLMRVLVMWPCHCLGMLIKIFNKLWVNDSTTLLSMYVCVCWPLSSILRSSLKNGQTLLAFCRKAAAAATYKTLKRKLESNTASKILVATFFVS